MPWAGRPRNLDSNLDKGKTYFYSPKRPPRLRAHPEWVTMAFCSEAKRLELAVYLL